MKLDPLFIYANYIEACVWAVLAIVAFMKRTSTSGTILAIALLLFGISDIVETHTGAWYRPWWMLTWKILCVLAILSIGMQMLRKRAS